MRRACSRHVPVRLRLLEALLSALGIAVLLPCEPAFAACDNTAPVSGQTVTCSSSAPNPSITPVAAIAGSTNVTVNVQAGAELDVTGNNVILVRDGSTVTNLGTLHGAGDTFDAISAQGTSGGTGQDVLINRGTIVTSGVESEGMFNSAAAVTMLNDTAGVIRTTGNDSVAMHDFASPGGGTLTNNGTLSTSGDGSHGMAALTNNDTLVNNGSITTTGAGSYGMLANGNAVGGTGNNVLTNHGTIDVSGASSHGLVSQDTAPGVVTNTGSVNARGAGGLGAIFSGNVTLNNAAGASIVSQQANAVVANAGGTFNNAGTIAGAINSIALTGGASTITNSGSITAAGSQAISVIGTFDTVINNTGTIAGGNGRAIWTDSGNDTFNWSGGTVTGFVRLDAGNDTANLTGLTDANLAGVPSFDGGTGNDVLNFNRTSASGLGRFVNWETVNVTNGSQLTLDANGLVLGDSGTLTGALNVDSTSTVFAGGFGGTATIAPAVAGQLVNVSNAGTIDLTNGATATRNMLVINGNYAGLNGRLLLQTVLGADGSPSDKLVIAQGVGSGNTSLGVANVGGSGGATLTDGILVVQATNGATTTATAFTLPKPLSVGAYTYYLFKGGVSAGTADNWYLRSSVAAAPAPTPTPTPTPTSTPTPTPTPSAAAAPIAAPGTPPLPAPPPTGTASTPLYRMEVPVYAEVPVLTRELGIAQIGTFHDRQGEQALLNESGPLAAAWARVWGEHSSQSNGGAANPEFSGTMAGVQVGHDIYADRSASGDRNHYGFFIGFARAQGDVNGFALGFPDLSAGQLSINAYSAGLYWTHIGPGGWYTDAVAMGSSLTLDPSSNQGIGASTHGHAVTTSLEAGLPIPLRANLSLEPQAQLIWQHASINDLNDGISNVSFHAANGLVGRLGLRLQGSFEGAGTQWQPYLRANLWRYFNGTDSATFAGTTVIPTDVAATAAQFGIGMVAHLSARGSVFATASYTMNVNGEHRSTVEGNLGARWSW
ncbi:autotransporter outer membrane beta-barrel domain-containing protein [Paraburkholderia sp. RP-4-7]|uniref:Autotransporter outer membrane beta-barrel domain-containing protein n=1 Tax=Paraburkholderia polaris TaxID=2728848 RepID=A0A848IUI9_9BURK|nr:autotransporter outer membrane beta-barrel domain-containing protein [Paraburkholderia polaris]NMM03494.1 autotransporter outer membrane beta-barrel domain-containing protein [Paraburkholderia polaris]